MSAEHQERIRLIAILKNRKSPWLIIPVILLIILLVGLVTQYSSEFSLEKIRRGFTIDLAIFFLIGLFAQLVDGTLGMGYGATSTSFLLTFGVPPSISSMAVHVAEMFTTGASAISHYQFKNINRKLALYLIVPGVIGAILGAYLLSDWLDADLMKPLVAIYMIILAMLIVIKGIRKKKEKQKTKNLGFLALFGGFMDSIGGGGWGPIVTSTLIGKGRDARYTIGSVNTAEFAIAFASGITFLFFGGIHGWQVIFGLIAGGLVAAPISAYLVNKIPRKPVTILVGILLILLSLRTLAKIYLA
jgi:uncharacterized protein